MNEILRRSFDDLDLEVRSDGRTIWGVMCPFDSPADIRDQQGDYTEVFKHGAFKRSIDNRGDRIPGFALHQHQNFPIGPVRNLQESGAGLTGEIYVSKTQPGEEVLELVRDGAMGAFSIGFNTVPSTDVWSENRDLVERHEVNLREVSIVTFPAYEGAAIAGIRDISDDSVIVEADSTPSTPLDPEGPAAIDPLAHSMTLTPLQARTRAWILERTPKWRN